LEGNCWKSRLANAGLEDRKVRWRLFWKGLLKTGPIWDRKTLPNKIWHNPWKWISLKLEAMKAIKGLKSIWKGNFNEQIHWFFSWKSTSAEWYSPINAFALHVIIFSFQCQSLLVQSVIIVFSSGTSTEAPG
jgi:hypothetical protein